MEIDDDLGFIKIHRSINNWGWSKCPNTYFLFISLLVNANYKTTEFMGFSINKGSLVFGFKAWSAKTGLTIMQLRTALTHLKSTNEITIKTTNKFSIISITNWEKYQSSNKQVNKRATNEQQHLKKERNKEYILYTSKNDQEEKFCSVANFEKLWIEYPRKEGKKESFRHFTATVNTQQDLFDITKALENYKARLLKDATPIKFTKQASTWFNNWRDYLEISKSAEELADEKAIAYLEKIEKENGF